MSTIPARLQGLLGSYLNDEVTTVSVVGAFTTQHSYVALDLHHPSGRDSGPSGPMDRHQAPPPIGELLMQLRRTCYEREMGTWFQIQAWLEPGQELDIMVNDLSEPAVTDPPMTDLEWQAEWFTHRRADEHLPPWWHAKLYPQAPQSQ
ncbi:hypothetical protein [Demequina muriae]|uniref:Uncharacterized protein n=1 Tax=Demequina muriae TaxID=3051664 RepID=A0ABT8GFS8_9MICO|nr:hypothetical protein [Demequina sp. EGI L300058]MDN4480277.1 hypothetical protein [Demequina sp. EGI L300058]